MLRFVPPKRKKWQGALIIFVAALTVYNILPSIFFYSKPLSSPVSEPHALKISSDILRRINNLESDSVSWLESYHKLLGIKGAAIFFDGSDPQFIRVKYNSDMDSSLARWGLKRAGLLINFLPAQLYPLPPVIRSDGSIVDPTEVIIRRNIFTHLSHGDGCFKFVKKREGGRTSDNYKDFVTSKLTKLKSVILGEGSRSMVFNVIIKSPEREDFINRVVCDILSYVDIFGENSPISRRYYRTYKPSFNGRSVVNAMVGRLLKEKDRITMLRIEAETVAKDRVDSGGYVDLFDQQRIENMKSKENELSRAAGVIDRQSVYFDPTNGPDTVELDGGTITIGDAHPFIKKASVDWDNDRIVFKFHPDFISARSDLSQDAFEAANKLIYNEFSRLSFDSGENIILRDGCYAINLSKLPGSGSMLVFDLSNLSDQLSTSVVNLLNRWAPSHHDLSRKAMPVYSYSEYEVLPEHEKKFCIVICNGGEDLGSVYGVRSGSIYVLLKGFSELAKRSSSNPDQAQHRAFLNGFHDLAVLLKGVGFRGYFGGGSLLDESFSGDYIFECEDQSQMLLMATREDFYLDGGKRHAILEFTDVEQRIRETNRIETEEHDELLNWRDSYRIAQSRDGNEGKYEIPKPSRSALFDNIKLTVAKYFRGDERKVPKLGLDFRGGKTIQIQLRDANNAIVSGEYEILQVVDELRRRVNKMGVSEVQVRKEGDMISLDFPGGQGISASALIKSSSMFFHIVNEKFSSSNLELASAVDQFLQDVWNEALVTGKREVDDINRIAWRHLNGEILTTGALSPVSESAKLLRGCGLKLFDPDEGTIGGHLDDKISRIAIYRDDALASNTNPLLIVFNNYALDGASLTNIRSSYDPSHGNTLLFDVQGSRYLPNGERIDPRTTLYKWTNVYSREGVAGSNLAAISNGEGWRMAVVLNSEVISAPRVSSPLFSGGSITGNFTQREINKLEADLKAGSLTFSPQLISERNVSPELGLKDRVMGISSAILAILLVCAVMVSYYKFAGVIAAGAVLCNLLIMWAALQNISAVLTLHGVAGIILTIGIAVDANVLVFEMVREEFSRVKKLSQAIYNGYKRAFPAILDSNITTLIAAIILLHFDTGPVKGFALTLIIGIGSSIFTALFLTRYFFIGWSKKTKCKELKMASLIRNCKLNFLRHGKSAIVGSSLLIVVGLIVALFFQRGSLLGVDFTGGYGSFIEVKPAFYDGSEVDIPAIEKALELAGISKNSFKVKQLSPETSFKILLGYRLDNKGGVFYGMPAAVDNPDAVYRYQSNPRLDWLVNALEDGGVVLTEHSLNTIDQQWVGVSGHMSKKMCRSAIIGLSVAIVAILVYITLRFEFEYALSSTIALFIDVLATLSIVCILRLLGLSIQVDINTIAALMTIIGYSLNDTIIIFDRIRTLTDKSNNAPLLETINTSLNSTLSRTIMTSGTTVVVLLAMLVLGGGAIFNLSLVMFIGVIFGTFSSIFVASPLLYFFCRLFNKEKKIGPCTR